MIGLVLISSIPISGYGGGGKVKVSLSLLAVVPIYEDSFDPVAIDKRQPKPIRAKKHTKQHMQLAL